MKTAIALPDDLFVLADDFAKQHGLSRSELYATTLRTYIGTHRHDDLTERINRACENLNTNLPDDMVRVARRTLLAAAMVRTPRRGEIWWSTHFRAGNRFDPEADSEDALLWRITRHSKTNTTSLYIAPPRDGAVSTANMQTKFCK